MRKATMQADAISHSALTGVALGVWLNITPLFTTLIYTTTCSIIVEYLRHLKRLSIDTLLSLFFSANLAIAIYLLSLSHGFTSNLNRYLFGSVTLIGEQDLFLLIAVCAVICLSIFFFWRNFWRVLIDEEGAKVGGV
jgi:zinc transport system permease protein